MGEPSIDKHLATKRRIEIWCGRAKADEIDWSTASDPEPQYNCFGFVLGHPEWWEPPLYIDDIRTNDDAVWPSGLSEAVNVDAYVEAAKTEGFLESVDAAREEGVDTIMLFFWAV